MCTAFPAWPTFRTHDAMHVNACAANYSGQRIAQQHATIAHTALQPMSQHSCAHLQCRSAAALLPSSEALAAAVLRNEAEALRQCTSDGDSVGCGRWWGWWAALGCNGPALSLGSCSSRAQALCCCHGGGLCRMPVQDENASCSKSLQRLHEQAPSTGVLQTMPTTARTPQHVLYHVNQSTLSILSAMPRQLLQGLVNLALQPHPQA
jgi:hypothetical protein